MTPTPEMIEAIEAKKYRHEQGIDAEMASFNDGLDAAIEVLRDAALALPPGEPVAWRWRFDKDMAWSYGDKRPVNMRFGDPDEVESLYAAPAPAPQPVAVKATEKEMILLRIIEASGGNCDSSESKWSWLNWFCNDETEVGGSDTFNHCNDKGLLHTTHNSDWDVSTTTLTELGRSALSSPVGGMEERPQTVPCPCTTFEQDEHCPIGMPSLLCSACEGKGVANIETVVALATEMLKVAEQVDELEDPFAAWESIELLKSASSPTPASNIAALREENERLLDELKKARREANDNVYMAHAYRVMLGPIASELAKKWEDYGVVRQHTSWGPDAHKLTGEERAKVLLDAFVPPPSALQHVAKGER